MADLIRDLRLGARRLRRHPGFTIAAVLCLAFGIGANTAVFSFANALFRDDRGIASPDRLVWVMVEWKEGLRWGAWSYPDYRDLRGETRSFTQVAAESPEVFHLGAPGAAERHWGARVSGNYFSTLGVEMLLGPGLAEAVGEAAGSGAVVVLSHGLWQRGFAGDPRVVGRIVSLDGRPVTVVGVAPRGFRSPNVGFAPELWVPVDETVGGGRRESRGWQWIAFVVARLAPGVGPAEAQAEVDLVMGRLRDAHPETNAGKGGRVYRASEAALHPVVRGGFAAFTRALFGVAGLVLFLACANVAGLLLARAASRRTEMAVRLSLGAGRGRLLRQLLAESLLLAALAGGAGLLLGVTVIRLLGAVQPPVDLPLDFSVRGLDPLVLVFSLSVSVLTGVAFGLLPALESTRPELVSSLKQGSSPGGAMASRLRRGLVVAQVALSLALLVGAGMARESLANARDVDLGFEPDGQVLVRLEAGHRGHPPEQVEALFDALRQRVLALPGVESAGWAVAVPLSVVNPQTAVLPQGHEVAPGANPPTIDYNFAGPGYFEAMGTTLVAGRAFEEADRPDGRIAIVNRAFVRRFWPGAEPLSRRVEVQGNDLAVVGVVEDGKYWTLGEEARPYVYLPIRIQHRPDRTLHVRATGDPAALLGALRREVQALDPGLPADVQTMRDHLRLTLFPPRLLAGALAAFAALALLLAAVGLYGLIAFWVSQATREIGVRMALGAGPGEVRSLVLGRAAPLAGAGLALGLGAALGLGSLATHVLYGVDPARPGVYLPPTAILAGVAFLAALLPARRAARVDPATALRSE